MRGRFAKRVGPKSSTHPCKKSLWVHVSYQAKAPKYGPKGSPPAAWSPEGDLTTVGNLLQGAVGIHDLGHTWGACLGRIMPRLH